MHHQESVSLNKDDFYLRVARSLSGCQLVEQELKLYITEALELVKNRIGNRLTFKMSGEDYENASLERLIHAFRKLNSNNQLANELDKFKDERNFLSHQGITHCLDWEGELFEPTAEEFQQRLSGIQSESERLREAIHEEANKFRGFLWFEDESDA